jgi:hypothetical protein
VVLDLRWTFRAGAIDGDLTRLHRLWHFAEQLDLQNTVVKGRASNLHVISKAELALEHARGNAAVQILVFDFVSLFALYRHDAMLGRDREFLGGKTCNRQCDLVTIIAQALDVMGG